MCCLIRAIAHLRGSMKQWWNDDYKGKIKETQEKKKPYSSATSFIMNLIQNHLEMNTWLFGEKSWTFWGTAYLYENIIYSSVSKGDCIWIGYTKLIHCFIFLNYLSWDTISSLGHLPPPTPARSRPMYSTPTFCARHTNTHATTNGTQLNWHVVLRPNRSISGPVTSEPMRVPMVTKLAVKMEQAFTSFIHLRFVFFTKAVSSSDYTQSYSSWMNEQRIRKHMNGSGCSIIWGTSSLRPVPISYETMNEKSPISLIYP